jgi:hypothetical protein
MTLELSHPDSRMYCPAAKTSQILTKADNRGCFAGARNLISEYDDILRFCFDASQ